MRRKTELTVSVVNENTIVDDEVSTYLAVAAASSLRPQGAACQLGEPGGS